MKRTVYIMVLMLILTGLYPLAQGLAQEQRPLIEYVQDLHMAEAILRPQARLLTITRDPFKPIITPAPKVMLSQFGNKIADQPGDRLDDVEVIGIVRLETEYRAYVMVGDKGRVLSVHDSIRGYKITDMTMDRIVFKSGNEKVIKKRGKK